LAYIDVSGDSPDSFSIYPTLAPVFQAKATVLTEIADTISTFVDGTVNQEANTLAPIFLARPDDLTDFPVLDFFGAFSVDCLGERDKELFVACDHFSRFLGDNQIHWLDCLVDRDKLHWILGSNQIHWNDRLVQRDKLWPMLGSTIMTRSGNFAQLPWIFLAWWIVVLLNIRPCSFCSIPGFSHRFILFRWLNADYSKCTERSSFLLLVRGCHVLGL
jgi:hypothetical protein